MDGHIRHRHGEPRPDGGEQRCFTPERFFGFLALGEFRDEVAADIDGEAVPATAGDGEGHAREGRAGGEDRRPVGIGYAVGNLRVDQ